ncbi:MAG: acyl-CoA dehydrogenase family protein, partial [Candidatus Binatia bacterium]
MTIDLKLSDEDKLVQRTAARFVERELLQLEGSFLKQTKPFLPPGDPPRRGLDAHLRETLQEKLKKIGFWALEFPEETGGGGLSHTARVLIYREFGRTALPFEPPSIPFVVKKSKFVERVMAGELSVALAFDETHKTGDLCEVGARYRKQPGGYCLNSPPVDVLNPSSDIFILPAREEGLDKIGLFLLEKAMPGLVIDREEDLTADQTVARLSLTECALDDDRIVGYEEDLRRLIATEQLRLAAGSLGMGRRCLEDSLEHARNRVTFGRPLSARQAIQWMLVDLSLKLRTSTWLTLQAAWQADQG